WFVFVPPIIFGVIGELMIAFSESGAPIRLPAEFLLLCAICLLVSALISRESTELAVTSKRLIAKFGLIRRTTVELNHSQVESFNVSEGILGRIFGFGTLIVHGTGGGKTPIANVEAPLEFRRKAMGVIDASQSRR